MLLPTVLFGLGSLLALLALPLWAGKIPPNRTYGFRTPLTVSNPQVWYATNTVAGRDLGLAGLFMMLLGGLAFVLPLLGVPVPFHPLVFLAVLLGPLFAAVLHTFWWASRYVSKLGEVGTGVDRARVAARHREMTELGAQDLDAILEAERIARRSVAGRSARMDEMG